MSQTVWEGMVTLPWGVQRCRVEQDGDRLFALVPNVHDNPVCPANASERAPIFRAALLAIVAENAELRRKS